MEASARHVTKCLNCFWDCVTIYVYILPGLYTGYIMSKRYRIMNFVSFCHQISLFLLQEPFNICTSFCISIFIIHSSIKFIHIFRYKTFRINYIYLRVVSKSICYKIFHIKLFTLLLRRDNITYNIYMFHIYVSVSSTYHVKTFIAKAMYWVGYIVCKMCIMWEYQKLWTRVGLSVMQGFSSGLRYRFYMPT